jgi:hypothetical protein
MNMPETSCDGFMETQIETLANFMNAVKRVPELYEERIGQLRDLFDLDLRTEFKNSPLWSEETKSFLDTACSAVVFTVDAFRVKPKPYELGGLQEIKAIVNDMQREMLGNIMSDVTECVCARTSDVCYPEKEEKVTV